MLLFIDVLQCNWALLFSPVGVQTWKTYMRLNPIVRSLFLTALQIHDGISTIKIPLVKSRLILYG